MWWLQTTGYHLGGLIWLIVVAVVFLFALVALIVASSAMARANANRRMLAERRTYEGPPSATGRDYTAADSQMAESARILHDRYARGEISREEYLQRRDDLMRAEQGVFGGGTGAQGPATQGAPVPPPADAGQAPSPPPVDTGQAAPPPPPPRETVSRR